MTARQDFTLHDDDDFTRQRIALESIAASLAVVAADVTERRQVARASVLARYTHLRRRYQVAERAGHALTVNALYEAMDRLTDVYPWLEGALQ
jgi:hypothetical protein